MPTQISVNYTSDSFGGAPTLDEKILIFENREDGWRFQVAAEIAAKVHHNGYALIAVIFSYFEMIAQYKEGKSSDGDARAYFRRGVKFVYPKTLLTDPQINTVYDRIRCGMYHNGYTKAGVGITGLDVPAISTNGCDVIVQPGKLLTELKTHFVSYIATLKNAANAKERANFEKIFNKGMKL